MCLLEGAPPKGLKIRGSIILSLIFKGVLFGLSAYFKVISFESRGTIRDLSLFSWFFSYIPSRTGTRPGQSWQPGTQSVALTWVVITTRGGTCYAPGCRRLEFLVEMSGKSGIECRYSKQNLNCCKKCLS